MGQGGGTGEGTARLLLTRPEGPARRFLAELEAAAGRPIPAVLSPLLVIVPVPVRLSRAPAGLILTSEAGAARAAALGFPPGLPTWCVGARTAAAAARAGLAPQAAAADAGGLVALLLARPPAVALLHLRGEHSRGEVAARLRAAGLAVAEAVGYRQDARPLSAEALGLLGGAAPMVAPLFSPRTAALLAAAAAGVPAALHVVALSDAVAAAAGGLARVSLRIAAAPDGPAMTAATLAALAGAEADRGAA